MKVVIFVGPQIRTLYGGDRIITKINDTERAALLLQKTRSKILKESKELDLPEFSQEKKNISKQLGYLINMK